MLVLVDYFSRWVEVDVIKSTSSEAITKCLDRQFSRYGVPSTLRSDNGPNLVSAEMEEYLDEMGIKHRLTTPPWPRANGEVARQNRSPLKATRVAHTEGRERCHRVDYYQKVAPPLLFFISYLVAETHSRLKRNSKNVNKNVNGRV